MSDPVVFVRSGYDVSMGAARTFVGGSLVTKVGQLADALSAYQPVGSGRKDLAVARTSAGGVPAGKADLMLVPAGQGSEGGRWVVVGGNPGVRYADAPSARTVTMSGPLPKGLALTRPIAVEVWQEAGEFVAASEDLGVHAYGDTRNEALAQLRAAIAEQHERLAALEDRLAPRMQDLARRFGETVAPRRG